VREFQAMGDQYLQGKSENQNHLEEIDCKLIAKHVQKKSIPQSGHGFSRVPRFEGLLGHEF
jgi:hypothetical protein